MERKYRLISCVSQDFALGKDNKLLWNNRDELKHFKKMTDNCIVIMGYNTFLSLNCIPLKGRLNYVLLNSTDEEIRRYNNIYKGGEQGVLFFNKIEDIEKIPKFLIKGYKEEYWVIGGRMIYELFYKKDLIEKNYISFVKGYYPKADTFFPKEYLRYFDVIDYQDHNTFRVVVSKRKQ